MAIKEFFTTFPNFRNHSVYIMGESYGGIYVPTLTVLIIRGREEFSINLMVFFLSFLFSIYQLLIYLTSFDF